jgi:mannose-6-phosphate isomerase
VDEARVEKPWGAYLVLDEQPRHKVKRIEVLPGQRLSYQRHSHRAEHWFIVAGRARVVLDGVQHELHAGQAIDVPLGAAHRVENAGAETLVLIETQTGDYFGEDDIERLADDYGRLEGQGSTS